MSSRLPYGRDDAALAALGADQEVLRRAVAPLSVVGAYIDGAVRNPARYQAVSDAIHADIFGQERRPAPAEIASNTMPWGDFVRAILGLNASIVRMQDFSVMFRRYPWRGVITRSHHMLSTFYLLAHECYIFEERLKKYFSEAHKIAILISIDIDINGIRRDVISNHNRLYRDLLNHRGTHVHVGEVQPAELDRLILIELLLDGFPHYKPLYAEAVRVARVACVKISHRATAAGYMLLAALFDETKPIWQKIAAN